nr:RNA-directed DNA polymerase, eukaryota, reverse transcriptase zinc-binding domain protein [Tanacetum cinerariifolium]
MVAHVESSKVNQAASTLGCQILRTPFKYLGTKLGGTMHRAIAWQEVIDKVKERLSKWKMKALSIGGRFTLLKSVFGSILIFHMSIYKAPMRMLKELESIRRQFFNGHDPKSKKASWVKWSTVTSTKDQGGLGVAGTKVGGTMHRAIAWQEVIDKVKERLSKWKMKALSIGVRFTLLKSVLGSIPIFHMSIYKAPMRVLKELESVRRQFFNGHDPKSKKASWVKWSTVTSAKDQGGLGVASLYALNRALMLKQMCEAGILKDLFPRIYALETCKDVNIRTKLEASSLETSLRRNADRYNWLLNNDGVYSVASLRKKIDNQRSPSEAYRTRWVKYIPIKVNIMAWKIKLNALSTRFNLSRRGIDIGSLMCPLCDAGIETSTHLFFRCNMADQIYYKIARWWNVTYEGFTSYTEWL